MKLDRAFYLREDVVAVAQELIGKVLVTVVEGVRTSGIITETEAYAGVGDRASHAYGGRRTTRNEAMYAGGGTVYVFICYGVHHLFNVVTGPADLPHAVLIRGVLIIEGQESAAQRRAPGKATTAGPGTLTQAMGITRKDDGVDLLSDRIWIEDRGLALPEDALRIDPRVGVEYAGPDALLPYRFRVPPSHTFQ